ncbi:MAG: UbiA family prenyltransferase [Pyrinomonadaceae bacterium]|nr:UbiA family prenyltransferase [Pyrinomonadaceae bacterium]
MQPQIAIVAVPAANKKPLCVDLDGTLIATDTLWESLLLLLKDQPWKILVLTFWLFKGKAIFKSRVAQSVNLNPAGLPYRENVLSFLRQEWESGREIILATACDQQIAKRVAVHLGIFSAVISSNGLVNLSGRHKLHALEEHVGDQQFDYIGNSSVDLPIWESADESMLVHPSSRLLSRAQMVSSVGRVFPVEENRLRTLLKALRIQQWVKNLLLFVPLITAHKIMDLSLVAQTLYAFLAFGLCASSVYVVNDLLDLEADRQHPRKKSRPFASGALQIKTGLALIPLLMSLSFTLAAFLLPPQFCLSLGLYFLITLAYSFYFKRVAAVDVLVLSGLYTLRILAGALAVNVTLSPWLLAFSIFFFLNLAFVKRYVELGASQKNNVSSISGRGYAVSDIDIIRSIGPVSGYLSVLVLTLYIQSHEVVAIYRHPTFLWCVGLCLLYWVTRVWILANRGEMVDDPIVFTFKDRVSYLVGGIIVILMLMATF